MNKRFTVCLTTLILSVIFSISASADKVEVDGIFYDISGTTATVTSGKEYSGDIVIPESITYHDSKYSVTSIGKQAFYFCEGLTSVTIPNSVTSFGSCAFSGCFRISHTIIVNDMFVYLPKEYEGHYSIPENISTIIGGAFDNCRGLTSITIPNSVTSIGYSTFSFCSGLTSVTIPNSVTSIGKQAFYFCEGLTSVTIPNSVRSIGNNAFIGCNNIENVYCYAEEVPSTDVSAFSKSVIRNATLHVPASAIEAYKTTEPWSDFGTIKAIDTTVGVESVKDRGIAIQSASGFVNISSLDNNETVSFYALDGKYLGSATTINGTTSFAAQSGTVIVAKIGKESIKIAVE